MSSNRNALAIDPSVVPARRGPSHADVVEAARRLQAEFDQSGYAAALGRAMGLEPETDRDVTERLDRAEREALDLDAEAEHAALTAEMEALPVADR